jgi:anti-sigma factor RsiW
MREQTHLADDELVMALDGGLTPEGQRRVDTHLAVCDECARRHSGFVISSRQLAMMAAEDALDLTPLAVSKARLRAALADEVERREASGMFRFMAIPTPSFRWLGVAVAIVVAIVMLNRRMPLSPVDSATAAVDDGALPIASLTPGAAWNLSRAELCSPARHEERRIANEVRATVVRNYGVEHLSPDEYELDYLITPELGGAPTAENLWPQMYRARTWNALVKDQLEDLLPTLVCDGTMSLQAAQRDLADDWIAAYKRHFQTAVPLAARASADWSGDEHPMSDPWRAGGSASLRLISFATAR